MLVKLYLLTHHMLDRAPFNLSKLKGAPMSLYVHLLTICLLFSIWNFADGLEGSRAL